MPNTRDQYADVFNSAPDQFDEMLADDDCEGDVHDAARATIESLEDACRIIRAQADS